MIDTSSVLSLDEESVATRMVDTGDARVAYRRTGVDGPAVFVLQQFWSAMDDAISDERSFAPQLSAQARVLMHDRRGAGASERRPGAVSMQAMIDDVLSVLADAGEAQTALIGFGESAALAVQVAVARPDCVSRLVLIDPALRPLNGPGSAMLLHGLRSKGRAGLQAFARTLIADDQEAMVLGIQMARVVDGGTAAQLYEAYLTAGTIELLERVQAPVLLVVGALDRLVSHDEGRMLEGRFSKSTLHLVKAHTGSDEAIAECWEQIRDFLFEQPAGPPNPSRPDAAPVGSEPRSSEASNAATTAAAPAGSGVASTATEQVDPIRAEENAPLTAAAVPDSSALVELALTAGGMAGAARPRGRPKPSDFVPPPDPSLTSAAPPRFPRLPNRAPDRPVVAQALPAARLRPPPQPPPSMAPASSRPLMLNWGPPPDVPAEAVRLNREAIDRILLGEIEEALEMFQRALDIAPHYEDAAVNHRELLSRLVQRRVSQWQNEQADVAMADAERRANRMRARAEREGQKKGIVSRLFRSA